MGVLTYRLPGTLESLDHLTPLLWDAGAQGLAEQDGMLVAHFATRVDLPLFDELGGRWVEDEDRDWIEAFRSSLKPVEIAGLTITPSWLADRVSTERRIVIDPGMAFGTGHHETTRMAIEALARLELAGKTVLDVGAGSGILAIVAAKRGARSLGVDNDATTLVVAEENARINGVEPRFIIGTLEDIASSQPFNGPFDVIVANLFAELHDVLMKGYGLLLVPGGRLILTGILAGAGLADELERVSWDTSSGRETLVLEALLREGFSLLHREQQGEWVLLEAEYPGMDPTGL